MSEPRSEKLMSAEVLSRGLELLGTLLPKGWDLTYQPGESQADASVIRLGQTTNQIQMLVEAKSNFTPRDVDTLLGGRMNQLRSMMGNLSVLVMAPWFSPQARQKLAEAGVNYLDLAGNLRIVAEYPYVYFEREVPRDRAPSGPRATPRLAGVKAGRVVRLLADVTPPYGVIELAQAAGVTPGYMSKILEALGREALLDRARRGTVVKVDWANLLRRRAEYYSVFETNSLQRFLCPNGPGFARETLADQARLNALPRDTLLTGSYGAMLFAQIAAPGLLAAYATGEIGQWIEQAHLMPADEGANVVVLRPYDQVVLQRPARLPHLTSIIPVVGQSQLVLDCLSGTGRMPAEGEALLSWMADHLDSWRLASLAQLANST